MLLTVAFAFWLASSFVEYKIVKSYPQVQPFFRGVPGICISLAIGAALSFAVGASNAMPIVLAQMVGLATNDFTYAFYEKMAIVNERRKEITTKVTTFQQEHPAVYSDAVSGVKAGFQTLVGLIVVLLWFLGLPVRIVRWVRAGRNNLQARLSHATA